MMSLSKYFRVKLAELTDQVYLEQGGKENAEAVFAMTTVAGTQTLWQFPTINWMGFLTVTAPLPL